MESKELTQHILNGQAMLREIRTRTTIFLLGFSATLTFLITPFFMVHWREIFDCIVSPSEYLLIVASAGVSHIRFILLGLAPLADDIWVTRFVLLFNCVISVVSTVLDAEKQGFRLLQREELLKNPSVYTPWVRVVATLILVGVAVPTGFSADPLYIQRQMWGALTAWVVLEICTTLWISVVDSWRCGLVSPVWPALPWQLLLLFVSLRPGVRTWLQGRLCEGLQGTCEKCAAAVVAGLVGECSSVQAMIQGRRRFRSVRLADLAEEDLASNRSDLSPCPQGVATSFGDCDAFVSHSWHDDASTKWVALQRWREEFVASHHREPTIWLDKCCIDQQNIDADLRCLPFFLSGCQNMVVF